MRKLFEKINHHLHNHLLAFLLLMYGLAALFPGWGVKLRGLSLGRITWLSGDQINLSVPLLMLCFLLFNAGFSVQVPQLRKVVSVPIPLFTGLLANTLMPLVYISIVAALGKIYWHNPDEIQNILVGLAIVASMPIAGSSTAWTQNSNGNVGLILGLVIVSTVLSPILSAVVFHAVGFLTIGDYSEDLHELATQGTSSFLVLSVVIPSLVGILLRKFTTEVRVQAVSPYLKSTNLITLLVLNYSNAATSLPQIYVNPDYDFLALIIVVAFVLCIFSFYMGWFIPKFLKLALPERIALMFGLGMNNNGTGLVLASLALTDHPLVMLPIIFYNLGQQIVAGVFNQFILKRLERTT